MSFIGQPIRPAGGFDVSPTIHHEPALPAAFVSDGRTVRVLEVLGQWKGIRPADHNPVGRGATYLQKHWYRLRTEDGVWTVYFERQARSRQQSTQRWWLYESE